MPSLFLSFLSPRRPPSALGQRNFPNPRIQPSTREVEGGERREQEHWVVSESFVSTKDFSFSIRLPEEKKDLPRNSTEVYELRRSQFESKRMTAVTG